MIKAGNFSITEIKTVSNFYYLHKESVCPKTAIRPSCWKIYHWNHWQGKASVVGLIKFSIVFVVIFPGNLTTKSQFAGWPWKLKVILNLYRVKNTLHVISNNWHCVVTAWKKTVKDIFSKVFMLMPHTVSSLNDRSFPSLNNEKTKSAEVVFGN